MILQDSNEPKELELYLAQSVEVQVGSYNQTQGSTQVYPDFVIIGGPKLIGVNRKQAGELLSSLDKVEEQLQRELAGPCEQLALILEGSIVPDGNGGCWAYNLNWEHITMWRAQNQGTRGSIPFTRHHFNQQYSGVRAWLTQLTSMGVMVVQTTSLYDTAAFLISLHNWAQKAESEHKTLNRLIKENITILGLDKAEVDFAITLMSVKNAGIGEELAMTIASLGFRTIGELFRYWAQGSGLCDTMVREKLGTRPRRIGVSAESKLQRALGYISDG